MDLINLNSFLKFGYFLDYRNPNITFDFTGINKKKYCNFNEVELIDYGTKTWIKSIEKNFTLNEQHLIPISGGLDSRAILAALLDFTDAKNLHTFTFGTPGTLDYEIGNFVAKKLGTNHIAYPLTKHKYSIEEEIQFSCRSDHQTILFHHPPILEILNHFGCYNVWSGFMGDPIAGSHLKMNPSLSVVDAIPIFCKNNTYTKSVNLMDDSFVYSAIFEYFNVEKKIKKEQVSIDELLDFNYRQLRYVEPHVLFKGFEYKLPFLEKMWFDFMLSVPNEYRLKENLYIKILVNSYPEIFSYKTKHNYGLSLRANRLMINALRGFNYLKRLTRLSLNSNINYIDFDEGIRIRNDLNKLIYNNLMDLKSRKIVDWIDIDGIWKRHINKQANHADALITLASLEIHLKAGKKI